MYFAPATLSPLAQTPITAHLCEWVQEPSTGLPATTTAPSVPCADWLSKCKSEHFFLWWKAFLRFSQCWILSRAPTPSLPSLCSFSTHIIPSPSCCPAVVVCFCNMACFLLPWGLYTYCSLCLKNLSPFPSSKMQNHDEWDILKYRLMCVYFKHTTDRVIVANVITQNGELLLPWFSWCLNSRKIQCVFFLKVWK